MSRMNIKCLRTHWILLERNAKHPSNAQKLFKTIQDTLEGKQIMQREQQ